MRKGKSAKRKRRLTAMNNLLEQIEKGVNKREGRPYTKKEIKKKMRELETLKQLL